MVEVLSILLPTQQQWGLRPSLMAGGVVCCYFLVVLVLSFRFKKGGCRYFAYSCALQRGCWLFGERLLGRRSQLLVGRWSIIKLGEIRIFDIVPVDCWQWQFENAAVSVRP